MEFLAVSTPGMGISWVPATCLEVRSILGCGSPGRADSCWGRNAALRQVRLAYQIGKGPLANSAPCVENVGTTEENAMSRKKRSLPKFAVGSLIRVKTGVTAPNYPNMPLGGWLGTVSQVSGGMCLVKGSGAPFDAIPPIYHQWCELEGVDIDATWLQEVALEGDPGEPLCIEELSGNLESTYGSLLVAAPEQE
jgi:hypothetical protein